MDIETLIESMENAENDNRKFALLLILAELMKSNKLDELKPSLNKNKKECKQLNERLFNSIGSHFLARLITTRQVAENCSPFVFKSLAFSILTQFLDYPNLVCDPILISKIDKICEILLVKLDNENDETLTNQIRTDLVLDVFKYLFALSKYCPDHLIQNSGLFEILMEKIILNENYDKSNRYNFETSNQDENLDFIACKLFLTLSNVETNIPEHTEFKRKSLDKCFQSILKNISSTNERFKFCLINYLNLFLEDNRLNNEYFMNDFTSDTLFNILNELFRSKINRTFKQLAFKLLNNFVKLFQFEYIYMKNRNFFYFIIHLLCIEIAYSLEEANQLSSSNNNNKEEDCEEANSLKKITDIISVYYSLMEEIIIILSTASPFDDDPDEEKEEPELKKVIKIIVETLEAIIQYVKDSLEDFNKLKQNELVLQIASIRLLICWLSHENLLEDNLIELMPKLIQFGEYYNSLSNMKPEEKINIFQFLSPGLERYLIDLEEKQTVLVNNASKSTDKDDDVKLEFEKTEIKDQINNINSMLQKCNIHI
jgi:hypothetical protein